MLHIDSQLRTVNYYLNCMKYSLVHSLCLVVIFLLVCSMSQCTKEDVTPQAETVIQGVIKDPRTGEPVPNIKIVIHKTWGNGLFGRGYKRYDSLYTKADGTYYLKFIPLGTGEYDLRLNDYDNKYFIYGNDYSIQIGKINTSNFGFQKAVKLTVKLKNASSQSRTSFSLVADTCCPTYHYGYYGSHGFVPVIKDTTLLFRVPYLSSVKLTSWYRGYKQITGAPAAPDTLTIKKLISIGKNDTTISVINP